LTLKAQGKAHIQRRAVDIRRCNVSTFSTDEISWSLQMSSVSSPVSDSLIQAEDAKNALPLVLVSGTKTSGVTLGI
jgi:hypothetical protein